MEPMFVNRIVVDEKVLEEWYKKVFYRDNPLLAVMYIGMSVVYLVVGTFVLLNRHWLPAIVSSVVAAVFFVLACVFVIKMVSNHRYQVRKLLKSDAGKTYPCDMTITFYDEFAMLCDPQTIQDPATGVAGCLQNAEGLQATFQQTVAELDACEGDEPKMQQLLNRLADIQKGLEGVYSEARQWAGRQISYGTLRGLHETTHLFIIDLEDKTLLVSKTGFINGTAIEFQHFIKERVEAAARSILAKTSN